MSAAAEGRLAENIVYFARTLRKAGMRVGPAAVKDSIEAVLASGLGSREDFYWTLHAVLVKRHEDHAVYDQAFRLFWRSRGFLDKLIAMLSPVVRRDRERQKPEAAETRVADALHDRRGREGAEEVPELEIDARLTFSGKEVLRRKDFAQMTADELTEARRAIADMTLTVETVATRRFRSDPRGRRSDPRAMMRSALRTGGDLIVPKFRSRRQEHPPLVILADISGSMSQYTRIFLHFFHAVSEKRRHVHTFVFGTRLTNLTRQMRHRDPDEALALAGKTVQDWSGGTRIGEALGTFNRLWSRRVLGGGAIVILITDGLERDDAGNLAREMERLHKSCRRLIWLNPLLRFEGFEPRARGVRAMLPHVDELRPIHNLAAMSDLCLALSGEGGSSAPDLAALRGLGRAGRA